ncbi:MAG: peptidoglycan bridge formation glycyltransferase FemA/FemB family protein [Candidatus Nomurabacteria bacterium]|jgi:lipid II:glycine glycyltransferase (peptidoglycan interpeptide bridge formation enzyme)|nr:peptidoglycan bridge formation glycyltransferase FemA/FemB family protein [Candidatus Nomurabacteria bacterium]
MEKHFLQSKAWARFQKSLGKQVFEDSGPGWSYLAILETTPLGKYLYLPYGPTIRDKNAFVSACKALRSLAEAQSALLIRIEPTDVIDTIMLSHEGFVKIKEVNPEHTWVLDLTQSEKQILAGMKQNNRNLLNNYAKKGFHIHHTTDPNKVTYLTSLLSNVATHNKIHTHPASYFKKQVSEAGATLYYVTLGSANQSISSQISKNGKSFSDESRNDGHEERRRDGADGEAVIAAALIYDSPTTRYYAHAAADYAHRKLSAGTVLVAQMILDAKAKGLKTFDFYGITTSENPNHPWYGFTKFKRSFGGAPLTYLGDWDLPTKKSRLKYRLFNMLRWLNRLARKTKRSLRK